jgi:hypothetical protein
MPFEGHKNEQHAEVLAGKNPLIAAAVQRPIASNSSPV